MRKFAVYFVSYSVWINLYDKAPTFKKNFHNNEGSTIKIIINPDAQKYRRKFENLFKNYTL